MLTAPDAPTAVGRHPLFIVFEGGEGSGKSTQAIALQRWLKGQGVFSLRTSDPGGTRLGHSIERRLKTRGSVPAQTELLLFGAARALLTSEIIVPALANGQTVICDRYAPSSVAYQGYGRGLSIEAVKEVNHLATGGLSPGLIVLLDIPPQVGLLRKAGETTDRFHQEDTGFHDRVRKGYLEEAKAAPGSWLVIDASLPRRIVSQKIISGVAECLALTRHPADSLSHS